MNEEELKQEIAEEYQGPPSEPYEVSLPDAISAVERAQPPVTVEAMILRAIDKGVTVDTMERLMAMRRELKAEMAKAAFDQSLAEFQRACPAIRKTKKVFERGSTTKVRYSYAPLESIVEQTKELIAKHGFSYTVDAQVETVGDRHWVTALCKVTHSAGHSQVSQFKVPIDPDAYMNEAQKFASALTFTKRYAFVSAFGLMTADEDDDSISSAEDKAPPVRKDAPGTASAPPPAPRPTKIPNALPVATEAHRKRLLEVLAGEGGLGPDFTQTAQEFFVKAGAILETESLDDLPLPFCPVTAEQKDALIRALIAFSDGEPAQLPYAQNPVSAIKPKPKAEIPAKPVESNDAEKQPWYGVIVPVPRRGQTRDEYIKSPDTIGSLYEARHGTDDLAQEARQRLYGFLHNYEPKGWTKRDGTQMPPSEADKKFRVALDQFGEWWEKWHAGEKI